MNIAPAILDAEEMWLGVAVGAEDGSFIRLAGRQRIVPVPHAFWSTSATDLHVEGELSVTGEVDAGAVDVTALLETQSIDATGPVVAAGDIRADGNIVVPNTGPNFELYTANGLQAASVAVQNSINYVAGADDFEVFSLSGPEFVVDPFRAFTNGVRFNGPTDLGDLAASGSAVFQGDLLSSDYEEAPLQCDPSGSSRCIEADLPLFVAYSQAMGTADTLDLAGLVSDAYTCWIGGVSMTDGQVEVDDQGGSNVEFLSLYVETFSGARVAHVDIRNELGQAETKSVGVVCVQRSLMQIEREFIP